MADGEAGNLLEEVRDLMHGKAELDGLRPVMFAIARAHDREVAARQTDRASQRSEYVRLQAVQVTILLALLTIVGLVLQVAS